MNKLNESVELPDPSDKKFLHPLDLPAAKPSYVRGWWFARLRSFPVVVAIGAVAWTVTGHMIGALLASASSLAIGMIANRWFTDRAWDYIPRKRQLVGGATSWDILATVIDAVAILAIATAVIFSMQVHALPSGVLAYAIGSAIGVAILQAGELVIGLALREKQIRQIQRLVMFVAVTAGTAAVGIAAMNSVWGSRTMTAMALGAATMLAAQAIFQIASATRSRGRIVRRPA